MIQLDDFTFVQSEEDVRAIRPLYLPYEAGKEPTIDPNRCMVLVGGEWVIVNMGVTETRRAL